MKLLSKQTMAELWKSGKRIFRRGDEYLVMRTASGRFNEPSYFLEPFNENEPFGRHERLDRPNGTIFFPCRKLS